jgi:anhydro-N-acetylmuramic acid kinase
VTELYLGLISGTSADGIDVALVSFDPSPRMRAAKTFPYPEPLRRRILDLAQGDGRIALDEFASLDIGIARCFADAALSLLREHGIDAKSVTALGSHGQTVRHRPYHDPPYTIQLGDPNEIAERTDILTIADFRRRDMSASGQGAPLAPAFHAAMLGQTGVPRVVLNLGGIANITVIAGDGTTPLSGFDTGTASCLLDAWAQENIGERYDANGAFAARGKVSDALLARLLDYPYFSASPPKSTGREEFHLAWLEERLRDFNLAPHDVQATLLAFSARTIADAIRRFAPSTHEVLACGGGVHNPVLMKAIADELKPISVRSIGEIGIDPDFVEAMTFAWLAYERLGERAASNVHTVTGARGPRVLGGVYFGG